MSSIPSTLTEQIKEAASLDISYRVLHPSQLMHNAQTDDVIEFPFSSLTNKYRHYLYSVIIRIQLSDKEKEKYKYHPKALSYDLYNTVEFWSDLLKLNGCVSISEFEPDYVKIYNPSKLKAKLNEILIYDNEISK